MFELNEARCKLCNVNAKPEMHGDDHVTATYITIEHKTSNTILDQFDGKLMPAFYQRASGDAQEALIERAIFQSSSFRSSHPLATAGKALATRRRFRMASVATTSYFPCQTSTASALNCLTAVP